MPLIIPASHSMRLPARPSRIALIIGIPPATAASKATLTPCSAAAAKISLPCSAISALLAVTTCLPLAMALSTNSLATVVPPISSTNICTLGSSATAKISVLTLTPSISAPRRAPMCSITISQPARAEISTLLRFNTSKVPLPTVPRPQIATFTGFKLPTPTYLLLIIYVCAV